MGKTALGIWNDIRKKEHRASRLGQIEAKLSKFYDNKRNRALFEDGDGAPNAHAKWIDVHRATTRSRQNTLEEDFTKEYEEMVQKYKTLTDDLLTTAMEDEHEYLIKLEHGN